MRYFTGLIGAFIRASLQQELAYRTNFVISLLQSLLNFGAGLLGLLVLFGQVETIQGWTFASTLAVLGLYLTVGALRSLFISPSLDSLAGMGGDIWTGALDFTLLQPIDAQFLASFRRWRLFALFDLILGLGVLGVAITQLQATMTPADLLAFLILLFAALLAIYSILLAFTGLTFWSPGFLFSWVFDGIFQMARYPVGVYPGWLRLVLTWVIPLGLITTLPAQALSGDWSPGVLVGSLVTALILFVGASVLFRGGLKRYASASS